MRIRLTFIVIVIALVVGVMGVSMPAQFYNPPRFHVEKVTATDGAAIYVVVQGSQVIGVVGACR